MTGCGTVGAMAGRREAARIVLSAEERSELGGLSSRRKTARALERVRPATASARDLQAVDRSGLRGQGPRRRGAVHEPARSGDRAVRERKIPVLAAPGSGFSRRPKARRHGRRIDIETDNIPQLGHELRIADSDEVAWGFRFEAHHSEMMAPSSRILRWRLIGDIEQLAWSTSFGWFWSGSPQAVSGEIEPEGVVNEAVENGVGAGGVAEQGWITLLLISYPLKSG
jgi:hypothetical protein